MISLTELGRHRACLITDLSDALICSKDYRLSRRFSGCATSRIATRIVLTVGTGVSIGSQDLPVLDGAPPPSPMGAAPRHVACSSAPQAARSRVTADLDGGLIPWSKATPKCDGRVSHGSAPPLN